MDTSNDKKITDEKSAETATSNNGAEPGAEKEQDSSKAANEVLYQERLKRVNDAVAIKEPDRVPCAPMFMAFPFLWAGYTMAEVNYDTTKAKDAIRRYLNHFKPDLASGYGSVFCGQMPMFEKLGINWMQWAGQPGSSVPDNSVFQYIEKEYMKEDEYPTLLGDSTGMMLHRYLPRSFKVFEPFAKLNFNSMLGYGAMPGIMQFANPQILESVKVLAEVAADYQVYYQESAAFNQEMREMGFPQQVAASTGAPFDMLSDYLRGTLGTMVDIMEQQDLVAQTVERFFPGALYGAIAQAQNSQGRFVFIPLHKGMDTFLSDSQYKKLYWDTLLRLINGLVEHGLTPYVYCEGPYDSRIECLMDIPKGSCWVCVEEADMKRVKKLLGNVACLSGGINSHSLMFGSREQVIKEVKENIDILAPGGGYIFELGDTMEDCKPENVEALFETVREYGKY